MLKRAARWASATARPTALPTPWPRGPVVTSTPGVMKFSGWPGVRLSHCLNCFRSSTCARIKMHFGHGLAMPHVAATLHLPLQRLNICTGSKAK